MPEERIPKLIREWIPWERRKRGRPRKTWMERVPAAMTTRNFERDQWRNRGMAFGFCKMATAVKKPDGWIGGKMDG
jgi:hypothetical protein